MAGFEVIKNDIGGLRVTACWETRFFGRHDGQLCQWLTVMIENRGLLGYLDAEVRSGRAAVTTRFFVGPVVHPQPCRIHAPLRWPLSADADARLIIRHGRRACEAAITIGSFRPWTVYLLSDACVDDTWAYDDVATFDRDDYRTTRAEVLAGSDNRYNLPTNYQLERFHRQAPAAVARAGDAAVRDGRLYVSPVPNQLNCAAYNLAAYPLLLEPYRRLCERAGLDNRDLQRDAYHMEAPTWSNGLANLLHCAGFESLGKSILAYRAPWTRVLSKLPLVSRLQVAPGRFMHLALTCAAYSDGLDLLAGVESANAFLHDRWLPQFEESGRHEGTTAMPLFGMYCDLMARTHELAAAKMRVVADYNRQGWEYPRLVNAVWPQFFDHIRRDYGPAARPRPGRGRGVVTLRGDSGASWELWMSAAQALHARFRRAQRDVTAMLSLDAMLSRRPRGADDALRQAVAELVQLGDHAWNGSHDRGRELNYSIRRGRLDRIEKHVERLRRQTRPRARSKRAAVVNTLAWRRTCRVTLPTAWGGRGVHVVDAASGTVVPVRRAGGQAMVWVADVPALGARVLELRRGAARPAAVAVGEPGQCPLDNAALWPMCVMEGKARAARGGWVARSQDGRHSLRGQWRVGPFTVRAALHPWPGDAAMWELQLDVRGVPPKGAYELLWRMGLPWRSARWRGESGGGFVTPGPAARGGDSLCGVTGSVFAAGQCLAAISGRRHVLFAFDQTGMARPGGVDGREPMRRLTTEGFVDWVLLGTGVNPTEAVRDQAGERQWTFRCGLRAGGAAPSDAALYRLATDFNQDGELVDPARLFRQVAKGQAAWLTVQGRSVLVLGLRRRGRALEVDLYNPADRPVAAVVTGPALAGRQVQQVDMLGRVLRSCRDGRVRLAARAFGRVSATPRR